MDIDEFVERHRAIVQGKAGLSLHGTSLEKTQKIPTELLELYTCIASIRADEHRDRIANIGTTTPNLPNKDIV